MRGRGWANQAPGAARGRRWEERPGAMETELHQHKFLTYSGEGRSRTSCTPPARRRRRAPGSVLHLLSLLPASQGKAAESSYHRWPSFYVVCRGKEGDGQLGAGELTSGSAGPWGGRAEEWLGLGDSMRGPWTERRSWDCRACARCGQPCSRCSPAEPKEIGCEYGGSRGARGLWQKGCPALGNFQLKRGSKMGVPRADDPVFGKTSGIGEESWGAAHARDGGVLQVVGHRLLWGSGEAGLRQLAAEQPPEGAVQEETVPAAEHRRGRAAGHSGVQEPVQTREVELPGHRRRHAGHQPPFWLRAEQR